MVGISSSPVCDSSLRGPKVKPGGMGPGGHMQPWASVAWLSRPCRASQVPPACPPSVPPGASSLTAFPRALRVLFWAKYRHRTLLPALAGRAAVTHFHDVPCFLNAPLTRFLNVVSPLPPARGALLHGFACRGIFWDEHLSPPQTPFGQTHLPPARPGAETVGKKVGGKQVSKSADLPWENLVSPRGLGDPETAGWHNDLCLSSFQKTVVVRGI